MLNGGSSHWADMRGILPADDLALFTKNGEFLKSLPADHYSSRSYTDFLMDSIRENREDGKPFLAYLAFQAVHDPVQVPEPWLSKYRGKYDAGYEVLKKNRWQAAQEAGVVPKGTPYPERHPMVKPWDSLTDEQRALEARGMEVYAGMLDAMDYNFGRIVNFLKDIGEYDNTVIIFFSDNGANPWYSSEYPEVKEKKFMETFDNSLENIGRPGSNYAYGMGFGNASGGPLSKFKMTTGEGGIRSPFLIAGPGIKGERQSEVFAYVTDIMPTILEMANITYPTEFKGAKVEPMVGKSMVNFLKGTDKLVHAADEFIGGEMVGGKWMRQGSYKAVMVPKPYGIGAWQLFDMAKDPGETKNLATEMPDKLNTLKAAWDQYAKNVGVVPSK